MGWVTYDDQGRLIKYYARAGPARAAVTRFQNQLRETGYAGYPTVAGCCSYRDFEGVLMGLRGDQLKLWQFCNTQTG